MAEIFQYNKIVKYKVIAECTQPMHIGNGENDDAQVLVHPVDGIPFIQASSLSGVFRNYYERKNGKAETEQLFGNRGEEDDHSWGSRIRISDGYFLTDIGTLTMELRPRVKINRKTVTVANSIVQGSTQNSGQKFSMEYIAAGAQILFYIYLYDMDVQNKLEDIFSAIEHQQIQFGGQKSNGCGYLKIKKLLYKAFNMRDDADRKLWMMEETLGDDSYTDRLKQLPQKSGFAHAYEIHVTGCTQGELLVKSMTVSDDSEHAPDCMNIQNAKKEYIIPGSSLKGSIRSQMEQIAKYLNVAEIIDNTFGIQEASDQGGIAGNIRFLDTVVGNREENDKNRMSHRIHIDKFTGGVIHGGLFTEKSVFGNVHFQINILNKNNPNRTLGLLLLALRDLNSGLYGIGSGSSVGRGFITVEQLTIKTGDKIQARISFADKKIQDDSNIIQSCLRAVRGN